MKNIYSICFKYKQSGVVFNDHFSSIVELNHFHVYNWMKNILFEDSDFIQYTKDSIILCSNLLEINAFVDSGENKIWDMGYSAVSYDLKSGIWSVESLSSGMIKMNVEKPDFRIRDNCVVLNKIMFGVSKR